MASDTKPPVRKGVGALILASSSAVRVALQFGTLPVLARLLGPSSYGLMALAWPLILFASILSAAGFSSIVARSAEENLVKESSLFWMSALMGLGLSVFVCLAAWPLEMAVGKPGLSLVICSLSIVLTLYGIVAVPSGRLQRSGQLVAIAVGDLVSAILGAAAAVYGAIAGWGVWALVAQQIATAATKFVLNCVASSFWPKWVLDRTVLAEAKSYSFNVIGANILITIYRSIDNFLIGAYVGAASLGQYSMSYQLVRLPEQVMVSPIYMTLVPSIAQAPDQKAAGDAYLFAVRVVAFIAGPALVGLAVTSHLLVPLFLGPSWGEVVHLAPLLAPMGLVQILMLVNQSQYVAMGRPEMVFRQALVMGVFVVAGILGGLYFGTPGVAIGCSLGFVIGLCFGLDASLKIADLTWGRLWASNAAIIIALAAMAAGILAFNAPLVGRVPALILCVAEVALGGLIYAGIILMLGRDWILADIKKLAEGRRYARRAIPTSGATGL